MTDQIFQLACDIRKITDELGGAKKMGEQHPGIYKNYLQLMRYGDKTKLRVLVNLRQFANSYNQKKKLGRVFACMTMHGNSKHYSDERQPYGAQ